MKTRKINKKKGRQEKGNKYRINERQKKREQIKKMVKFVFHKKTYSK